MNEQEYFDINGKKLYLDIVLIDYNEFPVFFVCRHEDEFYLVLCTDISDEHYYISKITWYDLLILLQGRLPMRDVFMKGNAFWVVSVGEDVAGDIVCEIRRADVKLENLPKEGACYRVFSEEVKDYLRNLEGRVLGGDNWVSAIKPIKDVKYSIDIRKDEEAIISAIKLLSGVLNTIVDNGCDYNYEQGNSIQNSELMIDIEISDLLAA